MVVFIRKLIRKEDGSLTLEAAIVMPFFMLFIVFLATILRITIADMALYKATSETSEVLVSFAYPAQIAIGATEGVVKDKLGSVLPHDLDLDQLTSWAITGIEFFFEDVNVSRDIKSFFDGLTEGPIEQMIQNKFAETVGNEKAFKKEYLKVTNVDAPGIIYGSGDDYLKIEVSYDLKISLPFVSKTITLRKTSYERLWTGS